MTVRRHEFLIPAERNPLAVYLLGLCAVSGLAGLAGIGTASTSHLPPWADTAWHVLLAAGGLLAVIGSFWRDAPTGLLLERAAMWPIAAGAGMYGVALAAKGQWFTAGIVVMFGATAAVRAIQIGRYHR